jgi:hypothetical protein
MVRRIILGLLAVFAVGATLGWSATGGEQSDVAHAQACGVFTNCLPDGTLTSALHVDHFIGPTATYGEPVEPDDGETWEINAVWAAPYTGGGACACSEVSSSVMAEVTWDGSDWQVSCTGCNPGTGPILDVAVCSGDTCSDGNTHGWSYTIEVDVVGVQVGALGCARFLERVEYTTTDIADGNVIDPDECTEGARVSPLYEPVMATDYGAFECAFTCSAAPVTTGIVYDD